MNTLTRATMLAVMTLAVPMQASLAGSDLTSRITGDDGRYTVKDLGHGRMHIEGHGDRQWIDVFRTGKSTLDVFASGTGTSGAIFDNSLRGDNRVVFGMCPSGRTKAPVHLDRSHGLVIPDCK